MEGIIDKLGWKKAAIILVGLSILGILFALFSFSNSEKQIQNLGVKNSPGNQGETRSSTDGGSKNNLPGSAVTPAQNLKTYTTSYFQISYPEHYNGVPYTVSKGVLSNVKLVDPASSRTIEIVVFDSSTGMVQLARPFEAFKYVKSSIGLNALTGTMYKGSVSGTGLRELVVLVPKNNTTIRVMATYQGKEDVNFEKEFGSIVNSLN
jgi:hypothetical protein